MLEDRQHIQSLHSQTNLEKARQGYLKQLEQAPHDAQVLSLLGSLCLQTGRLEEAKRYLTDAVAFGPANPQVENNLGIVFLKQGLLDKAVQWFKKALQSKPDYVDASCNLGMALNEQHDYGEAANAFAAALKIDPKHKESLHQAGNTFKKLGCYEQASRCYMAALALAPEDSAVLTNLGVLFEDTGDLAFARRCFEMALTSAPHDVRILVNLAHCLSEAGELKEAEAVVGTALNLDPCHVAAHLALAALAKKSGDYKTFFTEYEWRIKKPENTYLTHYQQPLWDGRSRAKNLLIHGEQGLADEVIYSVLLSKVLSLVDRCVVETDPRLVGLFARSFAGMNFVARSKADIHSSVCCADSSFDCQIPLLSLGRHFATDATQLPWHSGYLNVDPGKASFWKDRLKDLPGRLKVGICWRSILPQPFIDSSMRIRSSTLLSQWRELVALPGISFVNLQYGPVQKEVSQFVAETGLAICDWPDLDPTNDIDSLCALIKSLDLVISINSTAAYLAAGVGAPVWILEPYGRSSHKPLEFVDDPWFKGIPYFRQAKPGDWQEVFARVRERLAVGFLAAGCSPE